MQYDSETVIFESRSSRYNSNTHKYSAICITDTALDVFEAIYKIRIIVSKGTKPVTIFIYLRSVLLLWYHKIFEVLAEAF